MSRSTDPGFAIAALIFPIWFPLFVIAILLEDIWDTPVKAVNYHLDWMNWKLYGKPRPVWNHKGTTHDNL